MKMSYVFLFSAILMSAPAQAMTPQKYCESLPAVSCEVLNVEGGGCYANGCMTIVKFCRNQNFRIIPVYATAYNGAAYLSLKNAGGTVTTLGEVSSSNINSKSSADVCGIIP